MKMSRYMLVFPYTDHKGNSRDMFPCLVVKVNKTHLIVIFTFYVEYCDHLIRSYSVQSVEKDNKTG